MIGHRRCEVCGQIDHKANMVELGPIRADMEEPCMWGSDDKYIPGRWYHWSCYRGVKDAMRRRTKEEQSKAPGDQHPDKAFLNSVKCGDRIMLHGEAFLVLSVERYALSPRVRKLELVVDD